MATQAKAQTVTKNGTRVLLALWASGGTDATITKGNLMGKVKRSQETTSQYEDEFQKLEEAGAIAIEKKRYEKITLKDVGVEMLAKALNDGFQFDAQVGAKTANAVLNLMRKNGSIKHAETNGKIVNEAIDSYEEFKGEALSLFEKLNKGYNYGGLVPIWHLRHEVGERVERLKFNDWVMEMQAEKLFYLQTGEAVGATEEQKQDSIESEIRGLLFYISQPA